MCKSLFAYFRACCNCPTRACKIIAAFILFYFVADVRTCAKNAAIYFIAAFIIFYCTQNHSSVQRRRKNFGMHKETLRKHFVVLLRNSCVYRSKTQLVH